MFFGYLYFPYLGAEGIDQTLRDQGKDEASPRPLVLARLPGQPKDPA